MVGACCGRGCSSSRLQRSKPTSWATTPGNVREWACPCGGAVGCESKLLPLSNCPVVRKAEGGNGDREGRQWNELEIASAVVSY